MLDENQSKLSEDLMEFRRDASMLNVSLGSNVEPNLRPQCRRTWAAFIETHPGTTTHSTLSFLLL